MGERALLAPILQTPVDGAPPDTTTSRILAAALEQFEELGIRRTTMDDIARRARVSRVTIYRRFQRKEALVEAVILAEAQRFFAELEAAVAGLDSVEDRIVEAFVHTLAAAREQRLLNRLLRTEPEAVLPHLTTDGGRVVAAGSAFLAEQMRLSGTRADDVEQAAELVARLVLSYLLTPGLERPSEARRFARRYIAPLMTGAAVPPAAG
jgi:AcrR family transcriptional regulator